ncbi:MAG: DNA-binding response regulator [Chloroflexi bacterium]|nr:MAG: DNA-binding response regulator [Chloroflexota bacterium]
MWKPPLPTQIRILLVDGHAIVRTGLRTVLNNESDLTVVGEASRGSEALRLVQQLHPDVVLMDLRLPETDSIDTIHRVRHLDPACQVVVLTDWKEEHLVRAAIQAGAIGYLFKDVALDDLLRAVRSAARAEPTLHPEAQRVLMRQATEPASQRPLLTEREMDVLRLIAQGKRNKEIARTLYLTEGTVKGYISAILAKLSVDDRTQAALYAVKHRLVVEM